ncbi:SCO7613 C-terminal domain-containing membrane protein [Microbacterium testaceum]|uniref:SCO7613 C-terminal domain-containing membrane protein n=1 Tax=Microbacterium testaceum TaxID=2033 RepID=UPI000734170E|nr:hypothetical protein [Microbacterium testaceum]
MTEVAGGHGGSHGRAWPSQPELLTDTSRCPWCFAPITASPCATCGLDLSDPRTFDVLSLSQHIAGLVHARDEALRVIRADASARAGAAAPASPGAAAPAAAQVSAAEAPVPGPDASAPDAPAPAVEGPAPDAPAPAREAPVPAEESVGAPVPDPQPVPDSVPAGVPAPGSPPPLPVAAQAAAPPTFTAPPGFAPPGELHPFPGAGTAQPAGGPSEGGPAFPPPTPVEPAKPRRSGVQVFLLSVGVVLLAVAAAFFLTVAWVSGGLVLRSIIVGALTAGVIVTASVLRRRRLTATAEGIALLGIALVALDVWAVRANDLAGASGADARVYWGWAAVLAGIGFVVWARFAGLRAPLSAGVASFAVGPPLVVAGLLSRDVTLGWYAAGLTILVLTLAAPLVRRLARADLGSVAIETTALRAFAGVGAVLALISALVLDPESAWTPVAASVPLAALLAVHAGAFLRTGAAPVATVAAPFSVLALGSGVTATVVRLADATVTVTVPLLVAVVIALALEAVAVRVGTGSARTALLAGALTAAAGAGLAAVAPVLWALAALSAPLSLLLPLFGESAFVVNDVDATSTAAVVALVAAVVLAALVWRLTGRGASRRLVVWWAGAGVLLLVGPQWRVGLAIVLWYIALAITGVVLLRRRRGDVAVSAVAGSLALLTGWTLSFSSPLAWTVATLGFLVVLWMLASVTPLARVPATGVFVAFAAGSAWLAPAAALEGLGLEVVGLGPLEAVGSVASICLLLALAPWRGPLAPPRGWDAGQREAAAFVGLAIVFLSAAVFAVFGNTDRAASTWWAVIGLLATGAAAWIVLGRACRSWVVLRPEAAVVWPLLAMMATLAIIRPLEPVELVPSVAVASVALLAAAVALAVLRGDVRTRILVDAGTGVVALLSVTALAPRESVWLPLVVVAITSLIWSVDADGLFVSRSFRRHLVWLAVALGTGALWLQLSSERVETVEVYTLPLAGVLVLLAAANERARRRVDGRSVAPPAVIAFAGTALALVPTAVTDADDTVRVIVAGVAGAALLVAGAWVRPARTPDVLPLAVAAAGALSLLLVWGVQLLRVAERGESGGPLLDGLVLVVAAALAAAAVGCGRRSARWTLTIGRGAVISAAVVLTVGETVLVAVDAGPIVRAVLAVLVLGAAGAAALRTRHALTGIPVVSVLLGGAALVAVTGLGAGIRPIEGMTLPLAAVLLAAAAGLRERPLTPMATGLASLGIGVALLPSAALVADELSRAIAVLGASVALLVAAALVTRAVLRPLVLPTLGVAGLALVVAGGARGVVDLDRPAFDAWVLAVAVPLVVVAVLLRRRGDAVPAFASPAAVLTALGFAALLSALRLAAVGDESLRAAVTILAILALAVLWSGAHRALVFWAGVGVAAALGAVALVTGSADPVELVTAPMAAVLVWHGIRSLRARPELRSWPALGVGLALLLIPSLVFDFVGDNALWRVIALGVVALAVLLVGARSKLQAPVLLGGIVLIVHAIAQLWPWIASIYESVSGLWWLWLGIAGVLLIVVAATYERRIREVKAAALAIRALR